MTKHRIVVIDDDEEVASLIEAMLADNDRFTVVGMARDGHEGVELSSRMQPDAIVLDLELPHLDGLEAIPLLRSRVPQAKIVVFSAFPDPYTLLDVVQRGADAYVDKASTWAQLVPALEGVCELV